MTSSDIPDSQVPSILEGRTRITEQILDLLNREKAPYQLFEHAPVFTSAEAAAIRGTSPEQGAKALVVKTEETYHLLVLPGNRRASNADVRRFLGSRHLRFADKAELFHLTGCVPGAVPPFGNLFNMRVWLDEALSRCPELAFNAGSHTVSLRMKAEDLIRLTGATVVSFSKEETSDDSARA